MPDALVPRPETCPTCGSQRQKPGQRRNEGDAHLRVRVALACGLLGSLGAIFAAVRLGAPGLVGLGLVSVLLLLVCLNVLLGPPTTGRALTHLRSLVQLRGLLSVRGGPHPSDQIRAELSFCSAPFLSVASSVSDPQDKVHLRRRSP